MEMVYGEEVTLEKIKEDLLRAEFDITQRARKSEGEEQYRLDLARSHVELAIKYIMQIFYPETEPDIKKFLLRVGSQGES
jgi:hypothetical protein